MKCLNDCLIVIIALGNDMRYHEVTVLYHVSALTLNSKEQCSLSEFEDVHGTFMMERLRMDRVW